MPVSWQGPNHCILIIISLIPSTSATVCTSMKAGHIRQLWEVWYGGVQLQQRVPLTALLLLITTLLGRCVLVTTIL
jgi:hypothetical protein